MAAISAFSHRSSSSSSFSTPPPADPDLLLLLLRLSLDLSPSPSPSPPLRLCASFSSLPRNLKQLSVLFDELLLLPHCGEALGLALPRAASLCFREIFAVLRRAQGLFRDCASRSRGYLLLRAEYLAAELHEIALDLATFLDILPLAELLVPQDVKDLVRLLTLQFRRSSPAADPAAVSLRRDVLELVAEVESATVPNRGALQGIFRRLGVVDSRSCRHEIECLERDIGGCQADESWAPVMVALVGILRYAVCVIFGGSTLRPDSSESASGKRSPISKVEEDLTVPADFRCPISLELMRDPVVVATGQTYDRETIVRWIDSGHRTCPKSGQTLTHLELVPNRALKNLIAGWCRGNSIPFDESDRSTSKKSPADDYSNTAATGTNKAATEAIRMTANYLVEQLEAAKSTETKTRFVHEIRLLAKHGSCNRAFLAEAGGIPLLLPLLSSGDAGLQVNSVTALLNLSILEANKRLIMNTDGALDGIVHVLTDGATWRARENAAATVLSLSSIHSYRRRLTRHPGVVEVLVQMTRDGPVSANKDAMTAILSLAGDRENITRLVECGAIGAAMEAAGQPAVSDEAVAVLAALARRGGAEAVAKAEGVVARLVGVLRRGSDWARESAAAALVTVCRQSGPEVVGELAAVPGIEWVILELMEAGTERAKRKAASLGRMCRRWAAAATAAMLEEEQAATFSDTSVATASTFA